MSGVGPRVVPKSARGPFGYAVRQFLSTGALHPTLATLPARAVIHRYAGLDAGNVATPGTGQESTCQGGHDDSGDQEHEDPHGDGTSRAVVHATTLGMPSCPGPTR
jgi:hypothetical protein